MKKRLIGTLLLGALMVSSTSVFVSCKDYDDDINNIVATKADKTALEEARNALENEIRGLKSSLESVEGQITTLKNSKADKFNDENGKTYNLEDVWTSLKPLLAKAVELETRIKTAEGAISDINNLLGGQLANGKTYKEAVEDIYAKVEALETGLGGALTRISTLEVDLNDPVTGLKAVVADLGTQVEVLNGYKARVEAIEADYLKDADKQELITKINTVKNELEGKLETLKTDLEGKIAAAQTAAITTSNGYTDTQIAAAKTELTLKITAVSNRVDALEAQLNTLNVYLKSVLRGLVFKMQSYYEGVEATDITVLNYRIYTLPATAADEKETRGYTGADFKGNVAADFAASDANRRSHDYQPLDLTTRYYHKDTTRVLTFFANYYMNPSNAVVESDNNVKVVAFDRPFHSGLNTQGAQVGDAAIYDNEFNGRTTTYAANIEPKTWSCANGILTVEYDAKNPNAIRTIRDNEAVTVFATQVAVNKEGVDTLITSDFATLYKKEVKDIVISHKPSTQAIAGIHNGAAYATHPADSVNTHCGKCSYNNGNVAETAEYAAGLHLMQTVAEAAGMADPKTANQFNCQDLVYWNDSINLNKLVEVHYTTTGGDHTLLRTTDAAYNGLHFQFDLTGLYYGNNVTSESAHAAIKVNEDGDYILRPQMPDSVFQGGVWVGKSAPWDNNGVVKGVVGKQDRQTIGRTPLVRVTLLDKDNKVVDYGYIRIRITERPVDTPVVLPKTYTYNAGAMTASEAWCGTTSASPFQFKQKWIQMEYDIHHDLDLSQNEFENHFTADAAGGEFQQYYIAANGYAQVVGPGKDEKLGVISYKREAGDEETTVIEWDVTAAQLQAYITHCGANVPTTVTRLVKFTSDGYKGLPDVYVAIVASPLTVAAPQTPTGAINWDGLKNANYWYAKDSNVERSGFTEIHANVFGVEDAKEAQAKTLKQTVQATFVGNEICDITTLSAIKSFITFTNLPADATAGDLHFALKFVLGANTEFKGYLNGVEKTFVSVLRDQDRELKVYDKADPLKVEQSVAKLIYADATDSLNIVDVQYQHTDYAEAMLNYKRHNALDDNVLTAYLNVKARYKNCPFVITGDPIDVRFLRPINVENKDTEVTDAATSQKQVIYLRDLVNLSDWREEPFKTNYWYYYNIKSIEVIGVADGGTLDENPNVLTNMNQAVDSDPATSLADVSNLVEFKYFAAKPGAGTVPALAPNTLPGVADYGRIEYTNLGSTVQKFKVRVPVKVVYEWGGAIAPATGAGAIFTTVDINVKKTVENARQK